MKKSVKKVKKVTATPVKKKARKKPLKLEVGKCYSNRVGDLVVKVVNRTSLNIYRFRVEVIKGVKDLLSTLYTADGFYYCDKSRDARNLVREVPRKGDK